MGRIVKIDTDIFNHPVVAKDHTHVAVWLYLVMKCSTGEDGLRKWDLLATPAEIGEALGLPEEDVFKTLIDFENELILVMNRTEGNFIVSMKKSPLWEQYRIYKKVDPVVTDEELNAFFDKLWAMYPKQMGKAAITKKYKLELYNIGLEAMTACIKRYVSSMRGKEEYYYKGCNFFRYHYQDYLGNGQETVKQTQTAEDMAASLKARMEAKKGK